MRGAAGKRREALVNARSHDMKTHYLSLAALAAAMVVPGQAQAKAGDVMAPPC